MKRFICLAASCLMVAASSAQPALVTTPVMGFLTLNLATGSNFIGFALLPSMELQGIVNIDATDRRKITFQVALSNDQFNVGSQTSHNVEIVTASGSVGFTSAVTDTLATGNEVILANPVPAGVENGATVKVWKLWTLASVFGETNGNGLTGGANPDAADLVQIPNGTGYDQYFYSTGTGDYTQGWRKIGNFTEDQANVPFQFSGGVSIFSRSAKPVVIVGQVKPGQTRITLQPGNNIVANLCPVNAADTNVGLTLGTSNLHQSLATGPTSPLCDLVLIWDRTGYKQYYYVTGGLSGTGWRQVGSGGADRAGTPLPDGAYIIQRRGNTTAEILISQGNF